ncbi:hypothetical protein FOL46_000628 [Perkinsus olseni]|uniref:Uncharacterized protein n=1 Tax=Perkinsus olseni TaxID=32597 RepID=A0A7J6KWI2_PEROL|nr:hypothetical protein FOL46_000628 [Perkinsus olseni]
MNNTKGGVMYANGDDNNNRVSPSSSVVVVSRNSGMMISTSSSTFGKANRWQESKHGSGKEQEGSRYDGSSMGWIDDVKRKQQEGKCEYGRYDNKSSNNNIGGYGDRPNYIQTCYTRVGPASYTYRTSVNKMSSPIDGIKYCRLTLKGQCCVCNVAITLRELKPVRIEIMDGKPRSGDIITFNLCEVVDGICRPFDADTLQKSLNHKCGYDDKKNKIQIPPRMGRDFGWRYSRVVNVGDDDNNDEVRILLYREMKRLNNRIRDEEWVDDLECRLTPEEEALNSEEELEREFAPPPPSSSRYYDGFDVAEAFDRVITTGNTGSNTTSNTTTQGRRNKNKKKSRNSSGVVKVKLAG